MATKTAQTEEREAPSSESSDGPLLDMSDAAVKKLIKTAKQRGYVTYEEINSVLPSDRVSSEKIEDTMSMFSDMGVNVVESEEGEEGEEASAKKSPAVVAKSKTVAKTTNSTATERTDDPVRMYLREMGTVELLSREGEIAIAKRIEAGREAMIAGLCESPLTFQAIIIWRDELNDGGILLRDIIDLEATYAGPEAKQVPEISTQDEGEENKEEDEEEDSDDANESDDDEDDEEEEEEDIDNSPSLAAMRSEEHTSELQSH